MTNARKTSGRYCLVCVNENSNKKIQFFCNSLSGEILPPQKMKPTGLDLTTLDIYILEHFKNEASLRAYLKELGYLVTDSDNIYIAYQYNGVTKYLDLVYHHEALYDLAILCNQYKNRFSNYASKNNITSRELRKLISNEISHDELWKNFYDSLLSYIHEPDFYSYLKKEKLLDERTLRFIYNYLNYERCLDREQQEAFDEAKYYLMNTFTTYKSIRTMIVSRQSYFDYIMHSIQVKSCGINQTGRKVSYFGYVKPLELISQIQLWYLEEHSTFSQMSKAEQEDLILSILGLKEIPWYERTIYPVTQEQVKVLEAQSDFANLTYLEKIRYVNKSCAKQTEEDEKLPYQKKKV